MNDPDICVVGTQLKRLPELLPYGVEAVMAQGGSVKELKNPVSYKEQYFRTRVGQLVTVVERRDLIHTCPYSTQKSDPNRASSSNECRANSCFACEMHDAADALAYSEIPINEAKQMMRDFLRQDPVQVGPGSRSPLKLDFTKKVFSPKQSKKDLRKTRESSPSSCSSRSTNSSHNSRDSSRGRGGSQQSSKKLRHSGKVSKTAALEAQLVAELAACAGSRDAAMDMASVDALSAGTTSRTGDAAARQFADGDTSEIAQLQHAGGNLVFSSVITQQVDMSLLRYSCCSVRMAAAWKVVREALLPLLKGLGLSALLVYGKKIVSNPLMRQLAPMLTRLLGSLSWIKPVSHALYLTRFINVTFSLLTGVYACYKAFVFVGRLLQTHRQRVSIALLERDGGEPDEIDIRTVSAGKEKAKRVSQWLDAHVEERDTNVFFSKRRYTTFNVNIEVLNEITAIDRTRPGLTYAQFRKRLMADYAISSVVNESRALSGQDLMPTYLLAALIWRQRYQAFEFAAARSDLPLE
jgi:hypothetical protein